GLHSRLRRKRHKSSCQKRRDCEVRRSFSFELASAKPDLVDMLNRKRFWVIPILLRGIPL
ncbi:hypothetical protein PanWU01x14_015940, partial [Parasponia andersonii]